MDERTLTALKNSIAHWRRMATGTERAGEAPKANQCALCLEFFFNRGQCDRCPVQEKTRRSHCSGTPYDAAMDAWLAWQKDKRGTQEAFRAAAQKELEFLESLLPAEEAA